MDDPVKKRAAAIAAVMSYIKTEEEAVMMAGVAGGPQAGLEPPPAANLWGLSGRQAMMNQRTLMQMKAFHQFRPR